VHKVAAKLPTWKGSLMDKSSRLVLVKSTLMAAWIYAVMADKLPPWVRTEIDAICRKFLWVGHKQSIRGKCTVAWPVVTTPAVFGGLGVVNLKLTS